MVSYNGFDAKYITVQGVALNSENVKIGDFIKIDKNGQATLAEVNKPFLGIVVGINAEYFTVQVSGYIEVRYEGATMPMYSKLVVGGRSSVQNLTSAEVPYRKVVWLDNVNNRAGIIL